MSQTYMKRQREAAAKAPVGPAPEREAPALAGLQESGFEGAVDAIQNVEPHAGRRLSLNDAMAGRMEQQFGIRMDQVELRESPQAEQMDARAFAKGNVVQFAPGQFQPDTEQGRQLIQHELSHVVQQARGGVRADMPGMNLNTDEGLEHQADLGNLSAGGGAPMSVSSLNAETAPVQGGFFSNIKRFFSKAKTSHQVGKGMKRRDEVAEQMTAEHEAEQDEIASVMRAQGYSDEEIQAQQMFQRVNMSARRADPVNSATADFQDLSMGLDSSAEMDNTFARMGHGTLTQSARERQQQRLDHFNRNVLANGDEDQQAEQMAASLGASRVAQGESVKKYNMLSSINGGMRDDNAFKNNNFHSAVERYNASEAGKANPYEVVRGDSKRQRFLERHLTGTDEENDALFQDVVARGDEAMIPKLKEDVTHMMGIDMSGFETDEEGNLLSEDALFSDPQRVLDTMNLNKDMHNLFDLMKAGRITPEQLGVGAEGGPSTEDFLRQKKRSRWASEASSRRWADGRAGLKGSARISFRGWGTKAP